MKDLKSKKLPSVKYLMMHSGRANLIIRNGPSEEVKRAVSMLPIDRLTLEDGNWQNLSFLLEHKKKIRELFVLENKCDWSVISELTSLKTLCVGGWFNTKLKFEKLVNLETLNTYHNKGYGDSLYHLPNLKRLKILGWKEETCRKLISLKNLESLFLVEGRRLINCEGIEFLPRLRYVEMYNMRNLEDANALGRSQITYLELENCKKIKGYDFVRNLKDLLGLSIINCSDIPNLEFVMGLKKLDQLSVNPVLNGDIRKALELKNLRIFRFNNKRHYNLKFQEAQAILQEKWGDFKQVPLPECQRPEFYLV